MSNLKKTIQINPELFKIGGTNKTRKNKEKKDLTLTPIITPNNLKNKLLNRIKYHKTRENNDNKNVHNKNNDNKNNNNNNKESINVNENKNNISDEFYGAIDYLSELSKKQKKDVEKERYQKALNNKTIKNNNNTNNNNLSNANVFLELPPELQEYNTFTPEKNETAMKINYSPDNDVPYGCLKGGVKPSYRTWCQTKKNRDYPEIANVSSIRPPTPPKKNTNSNDTSTPISRPMHTQLKTNTNTTTIPREQPLSREQKLQQIKNKLKKIQEKELLNTNVQAIKIKTDINNLEPIATKVISTNDFELPDLESEDTGVNSESTNALTENLLENDDMEISKIINNEDKITKIIKKTTKRKFTLGKSNKFNRVSVLLKDKKTRKNIINAQRELKKTNINDVRKYLKKHGIIKVGTTAPVDILRKMFESSMLAGDITNINKEILLHNFINSEEANK